MFRLLVDKAVFFFNSTARLVLVKTSPNFSVFKKLNFISPCPQFLSSQIYKRSKFSPQVSHKLVLLPERIGEPFGCNKCE